MTRAIVRLLSVIVIAFAVAACQTQGSSTSDLSASNTDSVARSENSETALPRSTTARNSSDTAKDGYFIEFRSRYALSYGHSFVIFGQMNDAGQMINPEVAGLAPASDDPSIYMLGHVTPVPASTGWTDGDLDEAYMSANWRVMLSEPEYRKVVARIRELQANSHVWHAALYNCNYFVGKIARSMGYKTPFHWLQPQEYITKLREMNGGPNAIGYTRRTASFG